MPERFRNSVIEAAEAAVAAVSSSQSSENQPTRHLVVSSQSGRTQGGRGGATRPSAHPSVLGSVAAARPSSVLGSVAAAASYGGKARTLQSHASHATARSEASVSTSAAGSSASGSNADLGSMSLAQVREDFARRRRRMVTPSPSAEERRSAEAGS
jgi:hypothetical protein